MRYMRISCLYFLLMLNAASCGGGGGSSNAIIATPKYGAIEGYVYAPVGSGARTTGSNPDGYKTISGVSVNVSCGSANKNASTNPAGYFIIDSLPVGTCTVQIAHINYHKYQGTVIVVDKKTTTVGGTSGILLLPVASGTIQVTANISGGQVIVDGIASDITIPLSLSYSFTGMAPGEHIVTIQQSGYDAVSPQSVSVVQGQTNEVSFVLNPIGNQAPMANAGPDIKDFTGTKYFYEGWSGSEYIYTSSPMSITLDGFASSDPDGNTLTYQWVQESGPPVDLDNTSAATPTFIPTEESTYVFSLKVNDGYLESASDTMTVHVSKPSGKIVFTCSYKSTGSTELCSINADGSNLIHLTENKYDDSHPHWSPDGIRIAYSANSGGNTFMALINADGTGQTTTGIPYGALDWFPDGTILAWKYYSGQIDFYRANPDGTGEQRLTNIGIMGSTAQVSADGTKIAFSHNFGGDNHEIMVMNSDGSNILRLTNNNTTDLGVAWLPDGTLLYKTYNYVGDRIRGLYAMNADGTNVTQIPLPSGITNIKNDITASSDGEYIFLQDQDGYLHVMFSDGSASMSFGIGGGNPDYHPGP